MLFTFKLIINFFINIFVIDFIITSTILFVTRAFIMKFLKIQLYFYFV